MSQFVVIVRDGLHERCFGPFRSFKRAEGNAKAWGGHVLPVETENSDTPWSAKGDALASEQSQK
jgi:hypothetical protein